MDALTRVEAQIEGLSQRHQVLAGNIANAQTPGYKSKEFQFELPSDVSAATRMKTTNDRHLSDAGNGLNGQVRQKDVARQPSLDGNNVDLDEERALLVKNALLLEAQMRFATHYLRMEQAAAS